MSKSSSSARTPTKRILTELSSFSSTYTLHEPHQFIESLAPHPDNVLSLQAILSGHSLPAATGYYHGRWLLSITIPPQYPVAAPSIAFVTRICHPNVKWETGEICLDVLKENWTPVLGVVGALESIGRLLGEAGVDSPLNVDIASLERQGDLVGSRSLVEYWSTEDRYDGTLDAWAGSENRR